MIRSIYISLGALFFFSVSYAQDFNCDPEASSEVYFNYDFQKCAGFIQNKCSQLSEEEIQDLNEYRGGLACFQNFVLEVIMVQIAGAPDELNLQVRTQDLAGKLHQTQNPTQEQIEQVKNAAVDYFESLLLVFPEEKLKSRFIDIE